MRARFTFAAVLGMAIVLLLAVYVVAPVPQATAGTEYATGQITDAFVRKYSLHEVPTISTAKQTEVIAAPGAGLRIIVISIDIQSEGTQTFELESADTNLTGNYEMSDGDYWSKGPYRCAANEAFNLTTSAAVVINVSVTYVIVKD